MARMIFLKEKEFNEIFNFIEMKYSDYGRYKKPDETLDDFKGTDRWKMWCEFKAEIEQIKQKMLRV